MSDLMSVGFEHRTWNGPGGMVVEEMGKGPRVVLVHGGGVGGTIAWQGQLALAGRYNLVIPWRPGYGPSPAAPREDFEREAGLVSELLGDGAHLVGQSYGGVIALLAAAQRPDAVLSLTVVEPGAIGVARGYPVVDAFEAALAKVARDFGGGDPEQLLRATFRVLDPTVALPDPLPPPLRVAAERMRILRPPSEAEIPVDALRAAGFPKLVVNGGKTGAAFVTIAEVLAERIGAERFVIEHAGHATQMAVEQFNPRLEAFLGAAEERRVQGSSSLLQT